MMLKSISVVIPNFNGIELLKKNIPTLLKALQTAQVSFEVIIVDDASIDLSVEFIKANYPDFHVIVNEINSGFSLQ